MGVWILAGVMGMAALAAIVLFARRDAVSGEREKQSTRTAEVKDDQLKAAVDAPRDPAAVLERLRGHQF